MAWSLPRVAQGVGAHDRWFALALLVSLLLHSPLLLLSGAWWIGPLGGPALPLQVFIERPQPGEANEETRGEEAPSALQESAPSPSEPDDAPEPDDLPAASVDTVGQPLTASDLRLDNLLDNLDAAPSPESPPQLLSELPAVDGLPAPLAVDNAETVIEASPEPLSAATPVVAAIDPSEEAMLTRRLVREARELLASDTLQAQFAFEQRDRRFTVSLARQPASDETAIERVAAEIVAEDRGGRVQTRLQMKRLTFSHFTQLVDRWDESVLLHDDEIAGRFHSNSEIQLTYDHRVAPRLLGMVTTTHGIRIDDQRGWRPRREIFAGGLETRSARIRLPRVSLPVGPGFPDRNADAYLMQGDTLIVFHDSGDYDCFDLESHTAARRRLMPGRPTYLIGAGDAEVHVRGIVNGSVTVYSPERIVVQGNLTYAQGAATGGELDDYLGLVSDGNVEIDRGEVTGPGDLAIHAAVYARRRFVVRNAGSGTPATLFIYGSLTAGTLARTEPRYGTHIAFDPRFEHVRPPGFPETDRYEVEAWDGRWRVAPGAE